LGFGYPHLVEKKIKRLAKILEENSVESAVLLSKGNFLYMTGIDAVGAVYINPSTEEYVAIAPLMEFWKVASEVEGKMKVYAYSRIAFREDQELPLILGGLEEAVRSFLEKDASVAFDIEPPQSSSLSQSLSGKKTVNAGKEISLMRRRKTEEEIELIKTASEITERALMKSLDQLRDGTTERRFYAELLRNLYNEGADGIAFDPIVAFEENASNPHALVGERKLKRGNAVVIDAGAKFRSYCSDMTRTILYKAESYRILLENLISAYNSALDILRPGVRAKDVDMEARKALSWRGLEKYFIHSLGHGVGVEVHEPPSLSLLSDEVLLEGDVVTIEPGFYMPRKLGMRVENTVLVTEKGGRPLNKIGLLIEI